MESKATIYVKLGDDIYLSGINEETGAILVTRDFRQALWLTDSEAKSIFPILQKSTKLECKMLQDTAYVERILMDYASGLIEESTLLTYYRTVATTPESHSIA